MDKEFVPYQESLELKELGFDEPCFSAFYLDEKPTELFSNYQDVKNSIITFGTIKCTRPTFSQAFRWFREKYNIDAWVQPFVIEKSNGTLFLPDESYNYYIFKDGVFVTDKVDLFDHEEAELACLKKLIEIVKNK